MFWPIFKSENLKPFSKVIIKITTCMFVYPYTLSSYINMTSLNLKRYIVYSYIFE